MANVELRHGALWVNQTRVPLVAGEVHYWRISPDRWEDVLVSVRAIGVNVVSTYIPWEYHELNPGKFDFTGRSEPARNLVGFLDLLTRQDFWIFVRPGPYIYAEWTNAGVPDRVVTLPRLGDAYRQQARTWMEAVSATLKPYLATAGGRIMLVQADNEFDLFSHWFEAECGLAGRPAGFFQQFLAERYGDVAALNRAWDSDYRSFDDADAYAVAPDPADRAARARAADYWRFQHWATREGIRWHVDTYRRLGIDVPIVGNYYPGGDVQNWREVAKVVDCNGIDWYPRNEFAGDPELQRNFLDSCRYQRVISPVAFIAEFECGVWHGYHDFVGVLTPNHYRLMTVSAWLAGIQGFNWYMLAGRDNWYYTPINERGETRPELASVFSELHRVADQIDLPTLQKQTHTCAVFDATQIGTDRILADNPVLRALYDADIDYEMFDPEHGKIAKPLMFYAGADWLSRNAQQRLVEYVEGGGTLVLGPRLPLRDESFEPHNALGIVPPDRVLSPLGKQVELTFAEAVGTSAGPVWNWDAPPGEPIVGRQVAGQQQAVENADKWMTRYIGRQWTCGYRQRRGRGELIVLGLPLTASLIHAVHRYAAAPRFAQAELPHMKTGLARAGDDWVLLATNLSSAPTQCRVRFDGIRFPAGGRVTDLFSGQAEHLSRDAAVISLAARSGGAWRIAAE